MDDTTARMSMFGAALLLVAGCAHEATAPAAVPLPPAADAPPPDGGVAAEPAEPVADPSVEGALTLVEAEAVPEGQSIRLVAWLRELPADCPPCPEGYTCEQCLPPFHLFVSEPLHTGPGGTGRHFWVDVRPSLTAPEIGSDAIGQRFVLSGAWSTDYRAHGRLFEATEATPAPAPTAPPSGEEAEETPGPRAEEVSMPPPFRAGAVSTEAEALAAYERAWAEALAPYLTPDRPRVVSHWRSNMSSPMLSRSATRQGCSEGAARVRSTLGPTEQQSILYGTLADLEGAGDCWLVVLSAGFDTLMTYLAARDGLLVFAWWPPEG